MSGKLTVRELPKALADVVAIARFLGKRSPQGMHAWLDAYDEAVDRVSARDCPRSHAPENDRVDEELFHVLFKTKRGRTYRAVYLVDGDDLLVLRVRGPGQKLMRAGDIPRG